jgi:hypothetical protein
MSKEIMIAIDVESGHARAIHDDGFDFAALGGMRIERAGHVEFSNERGAWEVSAPDGSPVAGGFPTRSAALDHERAWVHARLTKGEA